MPKAYQSTDTDIHATVARDAMGFSLRYHSQDYENIGGFNNAQQSRALDADLTGHRNLYNGNINHMVTALRDSSTGNASVQQTQYHYDQLNRITQMQVFRATNLLANNSWTGASSSTDYKSQYTYDPNGNLLSLIRNGASPGSLGMDSLTYRYLPGSNKLDHVDDGVADANYTLDVDDQDTLNYAYDAIGNLVADEAEEVDEIIWNVGGKIRHIKRTTASTKPDLEFRYGPDGNRYCKIVKPDGSDEDEWKYTYYFRDASGNIMATYQRSYTDPDSLPDSWTTTSKSYAEVFASQEYALYGSERLGIFNDTDSLAVIAFNSPGFDTDGTFLDKTSLDTLSQPAPSDSCGIAFSRGGKRYELSNHLGNVLAVISDRKLQVLDAGMSLGHYFTADIWSSSDYYPFGMTMSGRSWSQNQDYRFGFNGKETDEETGLQDYGFRIYHPAISKFLSVDPLAPDYPWYTPYQFAGNTPIWAIDIDGLEPGFTTYPMSHNMGGHDWNKLSEQERQRQMNAALTALPNALYHFGKGAISFITTLPDQAKYIVEINGAYYSMDQEKLMGMLGQQIDGMEYLLTDASREELQEAFGMGVAGWWLTRQMPRIKVPFSPEHSNPHIRVAGFGFSNGPSWLKIKLGGNKLSKMTMEARKNSSYSTSTRNFATIEYKDLDGNIKYKSFMSQASGPDGHTEPLILAFLEENKIPIENLRGLHSEKIPCSGCTEKLVTKMGESKNSKTKITWEFDDSKKSKKAREDYIDSYR